MAMILGGLVQGSRKDVTYWMPGSYHHPYHESPKQSQSIPLEVQKRNLFSFLDEARRNRKRLEGKRILPVLK